MSAVEEWRPVVGHEGFYEVSNLGNVRSIARLDSRGRRLPGKTLAPATHQSGHRSVCLCRDGLQVTASVHRLVLEAFVGPCPSGMQGCHRNDTPGDNRLSNLRWDTHSENTLDRVRNGIHSEAIKTHCPSGHEYSTENTYQRPEGWRTCRACAREFARRVRLVMQEGRDARPVEVREWARSRGVSLPDRGPIPRRVQDAYLEAHGIAA